MNQTYKKLREAGRLIGFDLRIRKYTPSKKGSLPKGYIYRLRRNGDVIVVRWISENEFQDWEKKTVKQIAEVL